MAFVPNYLRRSVAILKMPQAIARGMSATKFLSGLKLTTGGYQKQRFLADWRSVAGIEKRKDAYKFVRRDRRPPMSTMADVEWELEKEYMYKVRVFTRTSPDEPMKERFVNIPSDTPLSPAEIEQEVEDRWEDEWKYEGEKLERSQAIAGYRRVDIPE
jgi:hypothetical protein